MADAGLIRRRYELDWLRVLAFGLLIFYHSGMLYVERWGFHYKSQYLSENLEYLMLAASPWRMLLIWFISGYAIGAVLQRVCDWRQRGKLALKRTVVLLLPLMVGLWIIVPPQLYAEMVQQSDINLSYWQFYQAFFDLSHPIFNDYRSGVWPHVDVNHLWYLRSLWKFTLLVLLLAPLIYRPLLQMSLKRILGVPLGWQLVFWCCVLFAIQYFLKGDSQRDLQGFTYFLFGALVVNQETFWKKLAAGRQWLGWCGFLNYGLLCALYFFYNQPTPVFSVLKPIFPLSFVLQTVVVVWWLLAMAQRYLNHHHPYLVLANRAVFPIYLVHQSLIILAAFWLTPYMLGGMLESVLVLLFTISISLSFVLLFWKLPWFAALVGLKTNYTFSNTQKRWGYSVGLVLVSPLILTLLV